jgi:excisionase family DNA binding protein
VAAPHPNPRYEPPREFASRIGVSRATVYRLIKSGDFATIKLRRRRLVDVPQAMRHLKNLPAA